MMGIVIVELEIAAPSAARRNDRRGGSLKLRSIDSSLRWNDKGGWDAPSSFAL